MRSDSFCVARVCTPVQVTLAEVAEHGTSFGPFVWAWHCGSGASGDAACEQTRSRSYALREQQQEDAAQGKMVTDPFRDSTVGLGEHGVFDDKFSFGEDPHTEFNQLDDVHTFRLWMRDTLEAVLRQAEQERPPSCDMLWEQSSWNTADRPGAGGGGKQKKRRRSRRAAAGKNRSRGDL
jgi:hypothetical protein